jgi:hypothetical protein
MKRNQLQIATAWMCAYLVLMDIAVGIVLRYPTDPRNVSPSKLSQFFEYGRSVEGKLAWMTRATAAESAPVLTSGWIVDPKIRYYSDPQGSCDRPIVSVYGMSHSALLAEDMAKVDGSFVVRSAGAPGAVPSWAYAAYLADKERVHSDVVVLAVMTSGVPLIGTTSGMTSHFDSVWPYTYPRYAFSDGVLKSELPPFLSEAGYREFFYDSPRWDTYKRWLREHDKYYDPLLFRRTILDNSSIVRMIRRAYAYSSRRRRDARVFSAVDGFNVHSEEVEILKSLVVGFAEDAKKNRSVPIVYIINNLFMGDHLYRVLQPTLAAHKILFLSTHEVCPPNDPTLFEANSHFIPSKNILLAGAMMDLIKANMQRPR